MPYKDFFLPKVQEMQSNIHKVLLCGKRHAEAVVWLVHELAISSNKEYQKGESSSGETTS